MWDAVRDQAGSIKDHFGLWWITVVGSGAALAVRRFWFIVSSPYRARKQEEDIRTLESSNTRLRSHNAELADANQNLRTEIANLRARSDSSDDGYSGWPASTRKRRQQRPSRPTGSSNDNAP